MVAAVALFFNCDVDCHSGSGPLKSPPILKMLSIIQGPTDEGKNFETEQEDGGCAAFQRGGTNFISWRMSFSLSCAFLGGQLFQVLYSKAGVGEGRFEEGGVEEHAQGHMDKCYEW